MISKEVVEKLVKRDVDDGETDVLRIDSKMQGWITTGHWAARAPEVAERRAKELTSLAPGTITCANGDLDGQLADVVAKAITKPLGELVPRVDLAIERKEVKQTYTCDGCECGACDGSGEWSEIEVKEHGQAVFQVPGAFSFAVVNPWYAKLLGGLTVKAHFADLPKTPLLGYAGDELVAMVMPVNMKPTDPATGKEIVE